MSDLDYIVVIGALKAELREACEILAGFGNPSDEIYCGVCYDGKHGEQPHADDCAVPRRDAFLKSMNYQDDNFKPINNE